MDLRLPRSRAFASLSEYLGSVAPRDGSCCCWRQMTYCGALGEGSSTLISYMEAVPGVHPIKGGVNPATWMLVSCLAAGKCQQCQILNTLPSHTACWARQWLLLLLGDWKHSALCLRLSALLAITYLRQEQGCRDNVLAADADAACIG